ncbi:Sec-independent protein translocase protein TatB [Tistrella bauzanensis]|jgi:sec-independent protein translocase protein TatB|uniref:Sec-independent protein translocase protein TatB n=1 Tax=Tistrella arctica TaxID=3133430 RepID=A0ABU9YFB0_9PROT
MFEIGWAELAVVFVVALLVIGPKDLPVAMRTVGVWMGRLRRMAREFQSSVDDVLRESELKELRERAEKASRFDMGEATRRAIDPDGALARATSPIRIDGDAPADTKAPADTEVSAKTADAPASADDVLSAGPSAAPAVSPPPVAAPGPSSSPEPSPAAPAAETTPPDSATPKA